MKKTQGELVSSIAAVQLNMSLLSMGIHLIAEENGITESRRELFRELKKVLNAAREELVKLREDIQ
jgi:DNA-binding transcriptional ArsR family regulator